MQDGYAYPPDVHPRTRNKLKAFDIKIKNDNIDYAVRNAIDLLGGINSITTGKEKILLKPNLVSPTPSDVTKPDVIKALAQLMIAAGKDVSIGEGSAAASPNLRPGIFGSVCRTTNIAMLNQIQEIVFDTLGYSALARSLRIPLINLHTGKMSKIKIPMDSSIKRLVSIMP